MAIDTPADLLPVGIVLPYAGAESSVPIGWLLCDGRTVSRTTYARLFALFNAAGLPYGSGDGSTTFHLPDFRGRIPVGLDDMGGTDAGRLSVANTLGGSGGAETHTLTTAQLPAHTHAIDHDHPSVNTTSAGSHSHTPATSGATFVLQNAGNNNAGLSVSSGGNTNSTTNTAGAHTHSVDLPNFTGTSGSTGSGSAHNNMQPYILLNYIIKY